jgi:hypothetical protein
MHDMHSYHIGSINTIIKDIHKYFKCELVYQHHDIDYLGWKTNFKDSFLFHNCIRHEQ